MIYQHKNTELTGTTRFYVLTFEDGEEKEIEVSVTLDYQTNPDFEEITNVEFLTEGLSEKTKEEIEELIRAEEWKI